MKANKTRKVHTQEFKLEALKLAERIGVAAALGVSKWIWQSST